MRVQQGGADNLFELARDFQGTILALIQRTNPASVSVVERYRYEPFGKVAIENASGQSLPQSGFGNDRFFLGRVWDAEVGLYDVRARWYEPDLGAFLAPDPLGAVDSWNFYQYGLAEPNSVFDSTGYQVRRYASDDSTNWPIAEPKPPPPHPLDEDADWADAEPPRPPNRWRTLLFTSLVTACADGPQLGPADLKAALKFAIGAVAIIIASEAAQQAGEESEGAQSEAGEKSEGGNPPNTVCPTPPEGEDPPEREPLV